MTWGDMGRDVGGGAAMIWDNTKRAFLMPACSSQKLTPPCRPLPVVASCSTRGCSSLRPLVLVQTQVQSYIESQVNFIHFILNNAFVEK